MTRLRLSELYTDFFRIDLDAPGGYARVSDVIACQADGTFVHRAFKLMRHDLSELSSKQKNVGLERFENELKILVKITGDKAAPSAITRIYDSGFVDAELSKNLHNLRYNNQKLQPIPDLEIVSTGLDIQKFLDMKSAMMDKEPERWLPYLVVDLAPYDDSLTRQIKALSAGKSLNLYALPVNTIVEMTLQLLDVMDYLHKNLGHAYLDWKPEHIYWNEESKKLKLVDWNVTTRLNGGAGEKQTIREDIRMLSGAALYCSLALTDPEELARPIGPTPTIPRDKAPKIPPRYWTDNPNFYQREEILDEKIKQLVQKALDPSRGFNSPQELKHALFQYVEKNYKPTEKDLSTDLPYDAVQYFRRARSYIAAKDYVYANNWLELAVETARRVGVNYPDAEQLLKSVRDIQALDEVKQKVNPVLEAGQWKEALDLYAKAVARYPENILLKNEFDGLQGLLYEESKLKNKGFFSLFTNLFRLRAILNFTKDIINPNNPLYSFVKQQYRKIRLAQIGSASILIAILFFVSVLTGKPNFSQLLPSTITPTSTPSLVPSMTPTQVIATLKPTATFIITPTLIPTDTLEPTATPIEAKAYGILFASYFFPLEEPNGARVGSVLKYKQSLKIVDSKTDHGALWYECVWDVDGVVENGWILAEKIKIVQAPTATP